MSDRKCDMCKGTIDVEDPTLRVKRDTLIEISRALETGDLEDERTGGLDLCWICLRGGIMAQKKNHRQQVSRLNLDNFELKTLRDREKSAFMTEILKSAGHDSSSWFTGVCKECGYNVVVTQSDRDDYWWYCSNKKCKHHVDGEHTGDMEHPDWVRISEKGRTL